MHAPQSPRPRTYLQRHGIKIIGVILVLGFLNALQPFDSYAVALWEYGQEVWQRYQSGEEEIEERARNRAKAQALLAVEDQYSHPAMKELEQAFIHLGDSKGIREYGTFPDLHPYRSFSPNGYSRSWVKHDEAAKEIRYDHCLLTRSMDSNGLVIEGLNFNRDHVLQINESGKRTLDHAHYLSVSIRGYGKSYEESIIWRFPYKTEYSGQMSELNWSNNLHELHVHNCVDLYNEGKYYDISFVVGLEYDSQFEILARLTGEESQGWNVVEKFLNRCQEQAKTIIASDRLSSYSSHYEEGDVIPKEFFYYNSPLFITGLKPEKQKIVHESTIKIFSEVKQLLKESWPRVHSDLKDIIQAIEEPRRKLIEATPDAP